MKANMARSAKIIPLRGRKGGEMTNPAALAWLRDRGTTTVTSWPALAAMWNGWDADRARKAVNAWSRRKILQLIPDKAAKTFTIIAPPAEWEGRPGKTSGSKPERRRRRPGKSAEKKGGKSRPSEAEIPLAVQTENADTPHPESVPEYFATSSTSSRSNGEKSVPTVTSPNLENTSAQRAENTSTPEREITSNSEGKFMGLFSRRKRTSEPPQEADEDAHQEEGGQYHQPAYTYGGGYPAMGYAGAPALHAEQVQWRFQPHEVEHPAPAGGTLDVADAWKHASRYERLLILIAFGLSATAAYMSVTGMVVLYPSDPTTIIIYRR